MHRLRSGRSVVRRSMTAASVLVLAASTAAFAVAGAAAWSFLADDDNDVEWVAAGKKTGVFTDGDQVYANELKTGVRLWKKSPLLAAGNIDHLTAKAKVAYVLATDYASGEAALRVVALDELTGAELWSTAVRDNDAIDESGEYIAVVGKTVFITGIRYDGGSLPIVDAFNAKTGTPLWSYTGTGDIDPYMIAGKGKVVAVAGQNYGFPFGGYLAILDAKTGSPIATINHLEALSDDGGFYSVAVSGKTVVAAGWQEASSPEYSASSLVAAYSAIDGSLLWKAIETTVDGEDTANDVIILGKNAVVAGLRTVGLLDSRETEGYVRAFDLKTGSQVWQVLREGGGDNDEVDDLVGKGKLAVACGERVDSGGVYHSDIIGIDAKTGSLLWTVADDPLEAGLDYDCDSIALSGKTVVFDSDGSTALARAASTK